MNEFRLDSKVALVTGALGLLGREHCSALTEAGAHVVATDLDGDRLASLAHELSRVSGGRVIGVPADVTDIASLERLRSRTLAEFGRVDVLVNNAAIDDKYPAASHAERHDASRFEDYSLESFRRQLDVNVTGVFLVCQQLGKVLAERGSGSIINVASTYGLVAPQQDLYKNPDGTQAFFKGPAYPTSKGAVVQFTRYLAAYWGPRGVRVNTLSPGGVFAGQREAFVSAYANRTPLGRMAERHDYRGALVSLASDASIYMTGSNLVVDGGWTAW